jgi:CHASE2 domain-containing sensor protein
MDISYLESYIEPVTMGICLIVGILIKTLKNHQVNQFIPCVVTVIGVVIATVTCMQQGVVVTPPVILSGMVSGLASTGCYELFRNLFNTDYPAPDAEEIEEVA